MDDILEEFKGKHREYLFVNFKTTELAEELKVSRQTIYNWLRGKTKPKPGQLKLIKEFLERKSRPQKDV